VGELVEQVAAMIVEARDITLEGARKALDLVEVASPAPAEAVKT
jgi:hypothetical protein